MKKLTLFILFLVSSISCNNGIHSKEDLLKYIFDISNNLRKEQELKNDINVSLTYIPGKLLNKLSKQNSLSKVCYFSFRISKKHKQLLSQLDHSLYNEILQVLSFRMQSYIRSSNENHVSINILDAYYQQAFGMTNYDELLIVLESAKLLESKKVDITIKEFGLNLGELTFNFETRDILNINKKSEEIL